MIVNDNTDDGRCSRVSVRACSRTHATNILKLLKNVDNKRLATMTPFLRISKVSQYLKFKNEINLLVIMKKKMATVGGSSGKIWKSLNSKLQTVQMKRKLKRKNKFTESQICSKQ